MELLRYGMSLSLLAVACSGRTGEVPLEADVPLHLEERISQARIEGSEIPEDLAEPVQWTLGSNQSDWRRAYPFDFDLEPARLEQIDDALRLKFDTERDEDGDFVGGVFVKLPGWRIGEWAHIAVKARAQPEAGGVCLGFDLSDVDRVGTILGRGQCAHFIADGTEQSYLLPADHIRSGEHDGEWTELVLGFWAREETSVDILSVTAIPKEAAFAAQVVGIAPVNKGQLIRRALFMHAPGRLEYTNQRPDICSPRCRAGCRQKKLAGSILDRCQPGRSADNDLVG